MADKIEPTCRDCLIAFINWYLGSTVKRSGPGRFDAGYTVDAYLAEKEAEDR